MSLSDRKEADLPGVTTTVSVTVPRSDVLDEKQAAALSSKAAAAGAAAGAAAALATQQQQLLASQRAELQEEMEPRVLSSSSSAESGASSGGAMSDLKEKLSSAASSAKANLSHAGVAAKESMSAAGSSANAGVSHMKEAVAPAAAQVSASLAAAKTSVASSASSLLARARSSFSQLTAYPTSVRCSKCAEELPVPADLWTWSCILQHVNPRDSAKCGECTQERPTLASPSVRCLSCSTCTTVPTTGAMNMLHSVHAQVSNEIAAQASVPSQFHCTHCNALLQAPTGPWTCQSCATSNAEAVPKCNQCSQLRLDNRVLCGGCNQSTNVASMKLLDRAKSLVTDLSRKGEKTALWAAGTPHVSCPTCTKAVLLPKHLTEQHGADAASSAKTVSSLAAGEELSLKQQQQLDVHLQDASEVPATTQLAQQQQVSLVNSSWSLPLKCTACNNSFTLMSEKKAAETQLPAGTNVEVQTMQPATQVALQNNIAAMKQ